jgi:hypothetical protein
MLMNVIYVMSGTIAWFRCFEETMFGGLQLFSIYWVFLRSFAFQDIGFQWLCDCNILAKVEKFAAR